MKTERINRLLTRIARCVRAAAIKPFIVQFILTASRSGQHLLPFSTAKEKSLDNQPPTLLFYRPAVSKLLLKEMPR
jgi:hypothetical protein